MLVEASTATSSSSPLKNIAPIAVERYDAETREYYDTERPDRLNFRVVDASAKTDHRFYHPGRPDGIKEAVFDLSSREGIEVTFNGDRDDGMVHYSRRPTSVGPSSPEDAFNMTYRVEYARGKRSDGLQSVSLGLSVGARIEISRDSPSSVFNEKTLHLALSCDPNVFHGHIMEVYQDQTNRTLRLTFEDPATLLAKTITFRNSEPTEDPLYETNKIVLMESLVKILSIERELTLQLPLCADVEEQKRRLEVISIGLFSALDAVSPAVQL